MSSLPVPSQRNLAGCLSPLRLPKGNRSTVTQEKAGMFHNTKLVGTLEAAVKAVKGQGSYFAFSPDTRTPALMIQRRVLKPSRFRKIFTAQDVDINLGQIWVGTVHKERGKLRFLIDPKRSKGTPRVNKMSAGLKRLSKQCNIARLRSAIIVFPQAEDDAAAERADLNEADAGMQRRGRYRRAFQTLDRLRDIESADRERVKLNEKIQKDTAGWLFDHALGKKSRRRTFSDEAQRDVWSLQKMTFATLGAAPTQNEMKLAAHFMADDVDEAIETAQHAETTLERTERIESVIADLELYLDNPPSGCQREVLALAKLLAHARKTLDTLRGEPENDAAEESSESLLRDTHTTGWSQSGQLTIPEDAEIITAPDPGVKAKSGRRCKIFRDKAMTDLIGHVAKGTRCVMSKTDTPGVVLITIYEKNEDDKIQFTLQGYTSDKAVVNHFQKRSHKLRHRAPLFEAPPRLEDIEQRNIGDCYMLAALGSIAQIDPNAISEMIRDNNDGTVTVRLFHVEIGEDQEKIFTPKYIRIEKSVHHKARSRQVERAAGSLWVQMIEKAFAAQGHAMQHFRRARDIVSSSYVGAEQGRADEAFEVLLGRPATSSSAMSTPDLPWESNGMIYRLRDGRLPSKHIRKELGITRRDVMILSQLAAKNINLPIKFSDITRASEMDDLLKKSGVTGELEIDYADFHRLVEEELKRLGDYLQQYDEEGKVIRVELSTKRTALKNDPENTTLPIEISTLEKVLAEGPSLIGKTEKGIKVLNAYLHAFPQREPQTVNLDAFREQLIEKMVKKGSLAGSLGSGVYSAAQAALLKTIDDGLMAGACLSASTRNVLPGNKDSSGHSAGEPVSCGLVGKHVYTITGVEPPQEEREDGTPIFILLRNPWGCTGRVYEEDNGELHPRPTHSAISKIELSEFSRNFSSVQSCETRSTLGNLC